MGLDMYLNRRTYVGGKYEHRRVRAPTTFSFTIGDEDYSIPIEKVSEIVEYAGYWRKANAIHQWFVVNVQDGKDDCGEYEVSRDQLRELLAAVRAVLSYKRQDPSTAAAKARTILPPQPGFFFGSTDIDEWYWRDLRYTRSLLLKILRTPEKENQQYVYQSSW